MPHKEGIECTTVECPVFNPSEREAIRRQLARILASPPFRNSKRYPALLQHLVERTLEGRAAELKERLLGVEVFGRPPDYDTNSDPVVRTSAAEIRRRIAQYYHEPGRENEIRIDLPLGSYVPEFHFPPEPEAPAPPGEHKPRRLSRRRLIAAGAVAVPAAAIALLSKFHRPSAIDLFWQPLTGTQAPVSICLARTPLPGSPEVTEDGQKAELAPIVAWADVATAIRLASFLRGWGQQIQLKRDDRISLEDFKNAPAVLVGAFNDPWTLLVTENLRFNFQRQGRMRWIQDSRAPSDRRWSVDYGKRDHIGRVILNRDYAIVSRLKSSRTGMPVLAAAGIYGFGTEAAGEFVTGEAWLEDFARRAPAGWQDRNVQIVISTEVIEDHAGPPKIESIHVW